MLAFPELNSSGKISYGRGLVTRLGCLPCLGLIGKAEKPQYCSCLTWYFFEKSTDSVHGSTRKFFLFTYVAATYTHTLIVSFFLINVGEYFQAAMPGFEKDSYDVV